MHTGDNDMSMFNKKLFNNTIIVTRSIMNYN